MYKWVHAYMTLVILGSIILLRGEVYNDCESPCTYYYMQPYTVSVNLICEAGVWQGLGATLTMAELTSKVQWDSLLDSVDTVLIDCDGE